MREKRKDAKTKKALAAAAKQSRLSKKKALLAAKTAEAMNIKRRKIWAQMAKKEIGKVRYLITVVSTFWVKLRKS